MCTAMNALLFKQLFVRAACRIMHTTMAFLCLHSTKYTVPNGTTLYTVPKCITLYTVPKCTRHSQRDVCQCRYLVVGGGDKKLHIWDAISHQYIRSLSGTTGHKDVITGLAFRDGTHELFSCGADRAVKLWNLDNMAYVDTLFGHQSEVCILCW